MYRVGNMGLRLISSRHAGVRHMQEACMRCKCICAWAHAHTHTHTLTHPTQCSSAKRPHPYAACKALPWHLVGSGWDSWGVWENPRGSLWVILALLHSRCLCQLLDATCLEVISDTFSTHIFLQHPAVQLHRAVLLQCSRFDKQTAVQHVIIT